MARLRYTDAALDNLADIADYVFGESSSRTTAERLVDRLQGRCNHLASLPGLMGRARPELRDDIRSVAEGNYVIFFRYLDGVLEVVAVLEGHRDIEGYFRDHN